jgi:hypothetical protein
MFKRSCCIAATLVVLILPILAQGPTPAGPPLPPAAYTMPNIDLPDISNRPQTRIERQAQIQMERDRQLALKRETDQLLEMASDLKQDMDKTSPSILSLDLLKKTEKIEKLAKSIREKMKGN